MPYGPTVRVSKVCSVCAFAHTLVGGYVYALSAALHKALWSGVTTFSTMPSVSHILILDTTPLGVDDCRP